MAGWAIGSGARHPAAPWKSAVAQRSGEGRRWTRRSGGPESARSQTSVIQVEVETLRGTCDAALRVDAQTAEPRGPQATTARRPPCPCPPASALGGGCLVARLAARQCRLSLFCQSFETCNVSTVAIGRASRAPRGVVPGRPGLRTAAARAHPCLRPHLDHTSAAVPTATHFYGLRSRPRVQ